MLYYKALHIIFVITWFAGLFYIVRLFIYHIEANQKQEPDKSILGNQFLLMEKKLLYIITWPSMFLAIIFGTLMLYEVPSYLSQPYMHLKLGFVFILILYHLSCQQIYKKLKQGNCQYTSTQLRLWNEVATLLLVSIVFLIVLKSTISFVWGTVGLIIFALLLMIIIRVYKKLRNE